MRSLNSERSLKSLNNLDKALRTNQQRITKIKSSQNLISTIGDELKIQEMLIKQIQSAKKQIQNYSKHLDFKGFSKSPSTDNKKCIKLLYDMQNTIQAKNIQINNINQEIRILKTSPIVSFSQEIKKNKNIKNYQLLKLSEEISKERKLLLNAQKQHIKMKKELEYNKELMLKAQDDYFNNLKTSSRKLIAYQEFLEDKKVRNEENSNKKRKKGTKRYSLSIKQLIKSEQQNKNKGYASTNLKDAQSKREIAESALKTLKKKHQSEMNQLRGKLQFLKDQNQQLDIKLKNKIQELHSAENRFKLTKNLNIDQS